VVASAVACDAANESGTQGGKGTTHAVKSNDSDPQGDAAPSPSVAPGDNVADTTTSDTTRPAVADTAVADAAVADTTRAADASATSDDKSYPPGPPGCGLDSAAFCETFDAPAGKVTRAGELDPARFSAARMCNIGGPTSDGEAIGIGPARVPTCRADLPAQVFPAQDALICDGNDSLQSNHLLVLVAAQNYGQNSYRIRQPFDFAQRTGTLLFDAEGYNVGNQGWISFEITEDPTPAPSFTLQQNFENGAIPRNGLEVQLFHNCGGDHVGVGSLFVYDDYTQTEVYSFLTGSGACALASADKLNRFTVKLSEQHIEVFATDASDDGLTFGEPISILSEDIELPFSRGYVHLTTHNHATLKYSDNQLDAWHARWDNVAFDGPNLAGTSREYEVLDALTETPGKVNIGFRLADVSTGPAQQITIPDLDTDSAVGAQLALGTWTLHFPGDTYPEEFAFNYRLNGHAWHEQKLSTGEIQMAAALPNAGTRAALFDVDIAELVSGDNTLELTTTGAPLSYPPVAFNIDLILKTQ
jgi:hypothetical protein